MRVLTLGLGLAAVLQAAALARQPTGVPVGQAGPALEGQWLTPKGAAPELAGKAHLVCFRQRHGWAGPGDHPG
jgi:hypothetical protein